MGYFNTLAFESGIIIMSISFLAIILYFLICKFWRIPILKFTVLSDPWFSIDKYKVNDTDFVLGWLPLGAYIKPYGMGFEQESDELLEQKFIPMPIFEKSKALRFAFKSTPVFVWLFILAIVTFLSKPSFTEMLNKLLYFIKLIFLSVINPDDYLNQLEVFTKSFSESTSNLTIVILIFCCISIISPLITFFTSLIDTEGKGKIKQGIGYALTLIFLWLTFWKIPSLIFSVFSFASVIVGIYSFLIGSFLAGALIFYITLFIAKSISNK